MKVDFLITSSGDGPREIVGEPLNVDRRRHQDELHAARVGGNELSENLESAYISTPNNFRYETIFTGRGAAQSLGLLLVRALRPG